MIRLRLASVPPPKVIFALGTSVVFEEVPVGVNPLVGLSASLMVKAIGEVGVFSFVDCGPITLMVGGVLGITVKTKSVVVLSIPSPTVTVIVAVPVSPVAGVMTISRLAPPPLKLIF